MTFYCSLNDVGTGKVFRFVNGEAEYWVRLHTTYGVVYEEVHLGRIYITDARAKVLTYKQNLFKKPTTPAPPYCQWHRCAECDCEEHAMMGQCFACLCPEEFVG